MTPELHAHCSWCGAGWPDREAAWPRTCRGCSQTTWLNPLPVVVVLIRASLDTGRIGAVDSGLLGIRRNNEPGKGKLALPGGFIDRREDWRAAAVREAREETGLVIEPSKIELVDVRSSSGGAFGSLVVFCEWIGVIRSIPTKAPDEEVSGLVLLRGHEELAFSTHTAIMREWFDRHTIQY